ncbi:MAG TPA: methylenetetrahydrofolate reductase [Candidatus Omnitrophota bacterium]|nr:methylenetetrahydrofolate reductase [Candidatus Omnitrophota bacterium]
MKTFKEKLDEKIFVITTEIGPPKGVSMTGIIEELKSVRGRVDAVNVTDQQSAVMRLGSIAASKTLLDNGYEPICQVTCRDRNRIALQSDVLSAGVLGIKNILVMTGDHPLLGDHPAAKPVYDLDSVNLLSAIKSLQEGYDLAGKRLESAPSFCVGAVVNPGAEPLEPEIIKMEKKIEAGAFFFQTQAIFDIKKFEIFLNSISHFRDKIRLLGGIVPIKSLKMAQYMNDHIPGVFIPESIMQRLEKTTDITEESVAIAADLMSALRERCDGIHFMPIRANHLVAKVLDKSGVR